MAKARKISIGFQTNNETYDWEFGKRLLEIISGFDPKLMPEAIANGEPINFRITDINECERAWAPELNYRFEGALTSYREHFHWRRFKSIQSYGSMGHSMTNKRNRFCAGVFHFRATWAARLDWASLYEQLVEHFQPRLGMLHLFTDPEQKKGIGTESFKLGSFGAAFNPVINEMAWAMYFGDEFAAEVDADNITDAGFLVTKFANGYLVKVSDDIDLINQDYQEFNTRRKRLKSLFREGLFELP